MKNKLALYIFEYDDGNKIAAEWFVAEDDINDEMQTLLAYKHLVEAYSFDNLKECIRSMTVESVHKVGRGLLRMVMDS